MAPEANGVMKPSPTFSDIPVGAPRPLAPPRRVHAAAVSASSDTSPTPGTFMVVAPSTAEDIALEAALAPLLTALLAPLAALLATLLAALAPLLATLLAALAALLAALPAALPTLLAALAALLAALPAAPAADEALDAMSLVASWACEQLTAKAAAMARPPAAAAARAILVFILGILLVWVIEPVNVARQLANALYVTHGIWSRYLGVARRKNSYALPRSGNAAAPARSDDAGIGRR